MAASLDTVLRANPLYRRVSEEDRRRLAAVSRLATYERGETIFSEGDASDVLYTLVDVRVKIVKVLPAGKEVILEILGPGDPLGAVAAYEARPYPASALTLEPCTCVATQRGAYFRLLETCPSLVRGLLVGLSFRLIELTQRIAEVAGSRVEARFAHLFLKLAERMGQACPEGTLIPLVLSRQDLADLSGTTIETAIRVMSRWGKDRVVATEKDGFVVIDHAALARLTAA